MQGESFLAEEKIPPENPFQKNGGGLTPAAEGKGAREMLRLFFRARCERARKNSLREAGWKGLR